MKINIKLLTMCFWCTSAGISVSAYAGLPAWQADSWKGQLLAKSHAAGEREASARCDKEDKEYRKHRKEMEREERKYRQEMEREDRQYRQEMAREDRHYRQETARERKRHGREDDQGYAERDYDDRYYDDRGSYDDRDSYADRRGYDDYDRRQEEQYSEPTARDLGREGLNSLYDAAMDRLGQ